jgi:serine/threonine protein kinase/DNA-binding winged helix-turn-helix (wHTH) protein
MPKPSRYLYEFGPFRLDPDERVLLRGEQVLSLTPKALETLIVLVENSRHVVAKDVLMDRVWRDIVVEETNLAQQVSTLRKVLGERPDGGGYIETITKRGYRFVGEVRKIKIEVTQPDFSTRIIARKGSEKDSEEKIQMKKEAQETMDHLSSGERISEIKPGTRLGRYEILSRLGLGGMGEIYLANDTQLERKVALKLLSEKFTRNVEWLRRFIHEAKAASALNHPNILTIHEVGKAGNIYFIATEFVEGRTLREQISGGPLNIVAAINISVQVAGALIAAHAAGIVHRDVKPENIMVRPDGYVKVLDFGLAKLAHPEKQTSGNKRWQIDTDPGIVMGTVYYMSPEQARGLAVDARSDVFSLGVVLYEMIAGRAPFGGATLSDVIVSILQCEPPPLSQIVRDVSPELERIVEKALRKDCEERYQTIKDFQLDLKSLQQELEIKAKYGDAWSGSEKPGIPSAQAPSRSSASPASGKLAEKPEIPEIRYAQSGKVNIAYQVIGDAPLDIVFVMGWVSHLEYFWSEPSFARFLRRLASFARVILFDKRGTGLSDHVPLDQLPTLEQRMDDVGAVMEAAGCERAVLCGVSEGGPMCTLFSATYPEKTSALVMIGCYARRLKGEGYPWGPTEEDRELFFDEIRQHWGGPVGLEERAPSMANDPHFREWWAAYLRHGASPGAALALTKMNTEIDIRHVLPTVRVPTLIIHRTGDPCLKVEEGRYLAQNIPGAKFVELPGIDHLPFVGDQDGIIDEIEEFLTGMRHAPHLDRVLATVLVARVSAEGRADTKWLDLLDLHHSFVRKEIELFKGRAVEVAGDHLLATFDGPARAIRAACAICDSAARLGVKLRTGLHTGECDAVDHRVSGHAVEIATEIAKQAEEGEVLVSSTVKDLVAGSGIGLAERAVYAFREDLGEWRLFAVDRCAR